MNNTLAEFHIEPQLSQFIFSHGPASTANPHFHTVRTDSIVGWEYQGIVGPTGEGAWRQLWVYVREGGSIRFSGPEQLISDCEDALVNMVRDTTR
jgi:hypothetical protein